MSSRPVMTMIRHIVETVVRAYHHCRTSEMPGLCPSRSTFDQPDVETLRLERRKRFYQTDSDRVEPPATGDARIKPLPRTPAGSGRSSHGEQLTASSRTKREALFRFMRGFTHSGISCRVTSGHACAEINGKAPEQNSFVN